MFFSLNKCSAPVDSESEFKFSKYILLVMAIYFPLAFATALKDLTILYGMPKIDSPVLALVVRELLFFSLMGYLIFRCAQKRFLLGLAAISVALGIHVIYLAGLSKDLVFGYRWLLPLLIIFSVPACFFRSKKVLPRIALWFFFFNFLLQLAHFLFGDGYFAKFAIGLNARNPGVFFYPAATAFFVLMVSWMYIKSVQKVQMWFILSFITSVLLCASLTGIIGATVLLFLIRAKLSRQTVAIAILGIALAVAYLHFARAAMTGSTYLQETGGGRVNIFRQVVSGAGSLPTHFGKCTNAAGNYSSGIVPDSLVSSMIGNFGVIWTIIVLLVCVYYSWVNYSEGADLGIIVLVGICSFGLNVTETGPSIMLAILSRFYSPEYGLQV